MEGINDNDNEITMKMGKRDETKRGGKWTGMVWYGVVWSVVEWYETCNEKQQ